MSAKLLYADISKPGGREENQDYTKTGGILSIRQFIVADGLGGQGGGACRFGKSNTKDVT